MEVATVQAVLGIQVRADTAELMNMIIAGFGQK